LLNHSRTKYAAPTVDITSALTTIVKSPLPPLQR